MAETIEQIPRTARSRVDLTPYLGTWINSNDATRGIQQFTLRENDGGYTMQALSANAPFDWGEVEIGVFADRADSQQAVAFDALYDFGSMEALLVAYYNKGLLVIAAYHTFKDNGEHSNYFIREYFFHQTDQTS